MRFAAGILVEAIAEHRVAVGPDPETEAKADDRLVLEAGKLKLRRRWESNGGIGNGPSLQVCARYRRTGDPVHLTLNAPVADRRRARHGDGRIARGAGGQRQGRNGRKSKTQNPSTHDTHSPGNSLQLSRERHNGFRASLRHGWQGIAADAATGIVSAAGSPCHKVLHRQRRPKPRPSHRRYRALRRAARWAVSVGFYRKDTTSGELRGVGIEIARTLAERVGVALSCSEYPSPPQVVQALAAGACDVALLGIDPERAAAVDFSPPVLAADFSYLVPEGSAVRAIAGTPIGQACASRWFADYAMDAGVYGSLRTPVGRAYAECAGRAFADVLGQTRPTRWPAFAPGWSCTLLLAARRARAAGSLWAQRHRARGAQGRGGAALVSDRIRPAGDGGWHGRAGDRERWPARCGGGERVISKRGADLQNARRITI